MKTRRPTAQHRKRRAADEPAAPVAEREEATPSPAQSLEMLRHPTMGAAERGRAALELQGVVGNAGVGRELSHQAEQGSQTIARQEDGAVQRSLLGSVMGGVVGGVGGFALAGPAGAAAGAVAGAAVGDALTTKSRPLSQEERTYAEDIFKDTLDYSVITITRDSVAATGASRTLGNTINLSDGLFVEDSMSLSEEGKLTLIHEMTHVWQYQHDGWTYAPEALWAQAKAQVTTGNWKNAYKWQSLDAAGVPWEEWNPEAQAEAVEDYNIALRATKAEDMPPLAKAPYYAQLKRLQKYIDQMLAGPPPQPEGDKETSADAGIPGGAP